VTSRCNACTGTGRGAGVDDLELATLGWVHWFNETWPHSALNYTPPSEFEQQYYRQNTSQQQPLPGQLASH
jgi:putative transposase